MSCKCSEKSSKAYPSLNTDCPCGCGGSCGCSDTKSRCGCKPLKGLGTFEEYPRPKSAMFDPRQIGKVWPEPHPDPLIPYVQANEGLLPYETYNQYKNRRNSMHGYLAGLGADASTPETAVRDSAAALINKAAEIDFAFDYVAKKQATQDKENMFHYYVIDEKGKEVKKTAKKLPEASFFYGMVPICAIRNPEESTASDPYEIYIRVGGPETRYIWYTEDGTNRMMVRSEERDYIYVARKNLMASDTSDAQVLQFVNDLARHYPLVFSCKLDKFYSTNTNEFVKTSPIRVGWSELPISFALAARTMVDSLMHSVVEIINQKPASDEGKQAAALLKSLLSACVVDSNTAIANASKGLASAFVERLQGEMEVARLRSKIVYEDSDFIGTSEYIGDYRMSTAFKQFDVSKTNAFEDLKENLTKAFRAVLAQRQIAMGNLLKEVTGATAAEAKVAQLEVEKANAQSQASKAQAELAKIKGDQNAMAKALDASKAKVRSGEMSSQTATLIAGAATVGCVILAYKAFFSGKTENA